MTVWYKSESPHLVVAPAACSSWRTIRLGAGPRRRGCTRSHGCCRAQSLRIATRLCILDVRDIKLRVMPMHWHIWMHSAVMHPYMGQEKVKVLLYSMMKNKIANINRTTQKCSHNRKNILLQLPEISVKWILSNMGLLIAYYCNIRSN